MRHSWALLAACLLATLVSAQDIPRVEVFGGFSYLHIDTQGVTGPSLDALCNSLIAPGTCPAGTFQVHNNFNGWNAALQFNATRYFGIKADFSGNYGTPVTLSSQAQAFLSSLGISGGLPKARSYTYLVGPVLFQSRGHFQPFVHGLFGANAISTGSSSLTAGLSIPGLTCCLRRHAAKLKDDTRGRPNRTAAARGTRRTQQRGSQELFDTRHANSCFGCLYCAD